MFLRSHPEGKTVTTSSVFPAVYRCLNGICSAYSFEYIRRNEAEPNKCPTCQLIGAHVRIIQTQNARCFTCGCCSRTIWL